MPTRHNCFASDVPGLQVFIKKLHVSLLEIPICVPGSVVSSGDYSGLTLRLMIARLEGRMKRQFRKI